VKPPSFEYIRAESIEHAVDTMSALGDEAKFIAGGQSLVPLMALRLAWPSHLVDIGDIPELCRIGVGDDGALCLGAATVQRAVERSADVARACPLLPAAVSCIGHFPIRNRGTVGGSIAHGDPASELPLSAAALEAEFVTRGPADERRVIPASGFFMGPLTTSLEPDELLEEIRVPAWPAGAGWGFHEFSRRSGDYAVIAVAAILQLGADGTIAVSRVAVAGAGPTPLRMRDVEAMLHGHRADGEAFKNAGAEVARRIEPHSDVHGSAAFRRRLSAVLTERALADAQRRVEVRQ
jgi:aerobic carbon-monoxide dehydrogenase medium subunit